MPTSDLLSYHAARGDRGGKEGSSSGGGSYGGSGAGRSKENSGAAGSEAAADAPGAMGTTDVGPLCTNDFKISVGAAVVCEEVARFTAPSSLARLFEGPC